MFPPQRFQVLAQVCCLVKSLSCRQQVANRWALSCFTKASGRCLSLLVYCILFSRQLLTPSLIFVLAYVNCSFGLVGLIPSSAPSTDKMASLLSRLHNSICLSQSLGTKRSLYIQIYEFLLSGSKTRRFNIPDTNARHLTWSRNSCIELLFSQAVFITSMLMLSHASRSVFQVATLQLVFPPKLSLPRHSHLDFTIIIVLVDVRELWSPSYVLF
jgi:hypothetical protein